ncbi:acyl-CoA dehydrogenase family member 10-like isoform X2 [Mizuhopecten yessoensis]|uniref:acyl-CoA dehydrogenase family member 10-like isoform X2 n=1 Tax=Mizuhopecten yessoensis TaxID=6573 RepID=UPI000B45B434|nr:acyl-CoA dehydrogenase family member 10-like isoform X2 [Mizuhopecten yessoensis]
MLRCSVLLPNLLGKTFSDSSRVLLPALCTASPPGVRRMAAPNQKKTKAVIFDLGGVIVPPPFKMFEDYEKAKGLPPKSISRVVVEGGSNGSWNKLESGQLSVTQFFDVFQKEYFDLTGKNIDVAELFRGFGKYLGKPYPQMIDAVQCVRAEGLKTALLTNNWHWPGRDSSNSLPLSRSLFDVIIESCVVGMRKPDPRIYEMCLKQLDVAPEESVFLDDLGGNLKAAKALGINTIKVSNPDVAIRELEGFLGVPLHGYVEGTVAVAEHLKVPMDRLEDYLKNVLHIQSSDPPHIRCFLHGQSNPTYYVSYGGKQLVLRKKPPGKLLPSAHAVEREFQVMQALGQHGVPMPKMYGLCEDPSVIGTPFYIMEYLKGRIFIDRSLPGMTKAQRRELFSCMADTLCQIHRVDISAAGLDSFGKKGGYLKRNFTRWARQYEASKTREIESMNKLMRWITERMPSDERVTVVHGDFRLDNLIFHPDRPEVIGVLDWELSTIGDPITDLFSAMVNYYLPSDFFMFAESGDVDMREIGCPSVEEFVAEYCQKMGIPPIDNWDFYVAFGLFRFIAIIQGVYKRAISGQKSHPKSELAGMFAVRVADEAWELISKSKLKPTLSPTAGSVSADQGGKRNYSTSAGDEALGKMAVTPEALPERARDIFFRVKKFINNEIMPHEAELVKFTKSDKKWEVNPMVEELKTKAKAQGLWNLFMPVESDPDVKYGAGLTNLQYAFMAEEMGKCIWASEAFNCAAPDTGNMETLVKYGTEEQKQQWLIPLLNGEIRSCFGMTEPQVASSDATNIESSIERRSDHYLINGHKWWTSGALHPHCKVCIFMGKTDKGASVHKQQSMILVPMDAPGVKIIRPLSVFGFMDEPAGHAEVTFENVKVPLTNILLGEGRGFEIAQGRLGPGRIHHCMRLIGNAERALELMVKRTQERIAFGKPLAAQGTIQADVAQSRIEIEQARLLTLRAAYIMDNFGNKVAAPDIAMIKVAAPNMALKVIDRAIQSFGGAGLDDSLPLASMFAWARILRLADGPDEVHRRTIARYEYKKSKL